MFLLNMVFSISLVLIVKNNIIMGDRDDKMLKCIKSSKQCKTIIFLFFCFYFSCIAGCYKQDIYIIYLRILQNLRMYSNNLLGDVSLLLRWGNIPSTHEDLRIIFLYIFSLVCSFSQYQTPHQNDSNCHAMNPMYLS